MRSIRGGRSAEVRLLHRGVVIAVAGVRAPAGTKAAGLVCADGRGGYAWYYDRSARDELASQFAANACATAPHDLYLASLPLACGTGIPDSFVSVHCCADTCRIGVVAARDLIMSIRLAPADPHSVAAHIGRLRCFWERSAKSPAFPGRIILMAPDGWTERHTIPFEFLRVSVPGLDMSDQAVCSAAGAAVAGAAGCTVEWMATQEECRRRVVRAAAYMAAAVMFGAAVVASGGALAGQAWYAARASMLEQRYCAMAAQGEELHSMAADIRRKAREILLFERAFPPAPAWSDVLEWLSRNTPGNIVLTHIGGQSDAQDSAVRRYSIGGTAPDEPAATQFLQLMADSGLFTDVKLLSMRREKNLTGFTLQCLQGYSKKRGVKRRR